MRTNVKILQHHIVNGSGGDFF